MKKFDLCYGVSSLLVPWNHCTCIVRRKSIFRILSFEPVPRSRSSKGKVKSESDHTLRFAFKGKVDHPRSILPSYIRKFDGRATLKKVDMKRHCIHFHLQSCVKVIPIVCETQRTRTYEYRKRETAIKLIIRSTSFVNVFAKALHI